MKPFSLNTKMLSMFKVFYPTGYLFAMFPSVDDANRVEQALQADGFDGDKILFLTAETVLTEVSINVDPVETSLPSAGTEGDTVRDYTTLARQGHCALMIHAPSDKLAQRAMLQLRLAPFSIARKYHLLAIEDLE